MSREWPYSTDPFKINPPEGAVGIVMPVRGMLKFARLSYYSIRYFTDVPYMFAFVNNMSDLTTRNKLAAVSKNHQVWMLDQHIQFDKGALVNFALDFFFQHPQVKFGAVIDSDIVVEPEWISRMLDFLKSDSKNGIASPWMNKYPKPSYGSVTGSCMAFRREVYEAVGKFPVGFGDAGGEDVEFCKLAELKGYRASALTSVEVHHFGGVTRSGLENTVKSTDLNCTSREGRYGTEVEGG